MFPKLKFIAGSMVPMVLWTDRIAGMTQSQGRKCRRQALSTRIRTSPTAPAALSYELFPPRSPAAAESLWTTIRELEATEPDYVSVTYGASGSNRDTAVELINRLLLESTLRPLAHLTCVGNTPDELAEIIGDLLDHGAAASWNSGATSPRMEAPPASGSLRYAQDLIELIRRVEQRRSALLCAGKIAVGVAAYPTRHPESVGEAHDVEVLLAEQRSGGDFAITQVFFHTEQYADLVTPRTSGRGHYSDHPGRYAAHQPPAGEAPRRTDRRRAGRGTYGAPGCRGH